MLRDATANDIPAIRLLMESVPGFWQNRWSDGTIARAINSANGLAFVWETDSRAVGFVSAHDVGFRGYLSELVVARKFRSQGIGRVLLQKVEQVLSERNHEILIADVWHEALPSYEALGWQKPDALLLRRKLGLQEPSGGAEDAS